MFVILKVWSRSMLRIIYLMLHVIYKTSSVGMKLSFHYYTPLEIFQ